MNIYVGNLERGVTEDQLKELFEAYGAVNSCKIIKDKFTGESRGFAFVEMADAESGNQAIEGLNGQDVSGRNVRVNKARSADRGSRPPRRGGHGGGHGGGYGGYRR